MKMNTLQILILFWYSSSVTTAFLPSSVLVSRKQRQEAPFDRRHDTTRPSLMISPDSSSILIAEESWRQYVPLVVSCLVIFDILLGSPVANSILRLAGQRPEENLEEDTTVEETSKERIDSMQVAQEALEKAQNTKELRDYLEENKSDWQRMEEIKRKMDDQLNELDDKQQKQTKL